MTTAAGSFEITGWDETDLHTEDGIRVYRVEVHKTITGGIAGTARGWMTMVIAPGDSAAYVGFDRLDVVLDGRSGSFLVRHDATMHADGGDARWDVVVGSGTGELAGIRGTAAVERDADGGHTYAITYELASPSDPAVTVSP